MSDVDDFSQRENVRACTSSGLAKAGCGPCTSVTERRWLALAAFTHGLTHAE